MSAVLQPHIEMLPMALYDVDEVLAIEYAVCPFPWGRGNFTDSLASGYSCWVCRVDGEMVGYFVLMMVIDEAHLLTISVAKKRQGMGFGARLLRHAMETAQGGGAKRMFLEVRPSNEKAQTLYRHFGFRQIGVRRDYYPAVGGRENALVLARELTENVA
ncbi:ribosomal protein S18-alanine N-acetyltransferase [Propionivibrio soli]|uniref:ribosomal protein S18-alanine N-acetyltransferase n=1 Tax=Propionivibrio soli TaxID=2976531 RepID=UPI0021E99145|nr:ribosomal protein S18-alanine N-acetyltransferase [Propionivibrio soli]